jgi:hypothetical protein
MAILKQTRLRLAGIVAVSSIAGFVAGGSAMAYQGHMMSALHALQIADGQLEMAGPDKGGHRVNAINLVNQAISEVRAGMVVGAE